MPTCKFLLAWLYTSEPNPDGLVHFCIQNAQIEIKQKEDSFVIWLVTCKTSIFSKCYLCFIVTKIELNS